MIEFKTEILTDRGFVDSKLVYENENSYKLVHFNTKTKEISYSVIVDTWKKYYQSIFKVEGKRTCQLLEREGKVLLKDEGLKSIDYLLSNQIPENQIILSGIKNNEFSLNISDNFLKLIIWTVTKGAYDKGNEVIWFRYYNPDKVKSLSKLLDLLKIEYSLVRAKGKVRKYPPKSIILNKDISEVLLSIVGIKREFPQEIKLLDSRQFRIFLNEMIYLLGNPDKLNLLDLITSSKNDVDILQELAVFNGLNSFINIKVNNKGNTFYVNHVNDKDNSYYLSVEEIGGFNDYLYYFKTTNGTLITRINGKLAVVSDNF